MASAHNLFVPGSRILLRPRDDGVVPYLTVADLAELNGVGQTYIAKVLEWLRAEHPAQFREGTEFTMGPDGYRGQIPVAKELDTDWSWAVWDEVVDTVLNKANARR
jgi:hypothetical protein